MKRFKPQILIPLALLIALGVGGWYVEVQRARQRSALSGFFENQPTQISSRVGGRISRILVREGDTVHKGQPLIDLEAAPAVNETAAKEAAAQQAREQEREVVNGPRVEDIRKQEAAVAEAAADLDRLRHGPRPEEIAQAKAAERNAKARLAQAKRGLTPEERAEAKARLDDAVAQEDLAREDEVRTDSLYREGAISRQQYDRAHTDLKEAQAKRVEQQEAWRRADEGTPAEELEQARQSYKQAKAALDLVLAGSREEDIRAAKARLQQAQESLAELKAGSRTEQIAQSKAAAQSAKATAQSSQANLVEQVVRAPLDGVVESIPVAVGDLASPQMTLLRLDNPKDIWVRVYVPEAELSNIAVGSHARLRVDGIDSPVEAYVESIASHGEFTPANLQTPDERGKQVFGVRLRLLHPDSRIKAGMYTTAEQIGEWKP